VRKKGTRKMPYFYMSLYFVSPYFLINRSFSQSEGKIELLGEQGLLKLISYAFSLDGSKPAKINTLKEFINL
jgi:hypothetical protein